MQKKTVLSILIGITIIIAVCTCLFDLNKENKQIKQIINHEGISKEKKIKPQKQITPIEITPDEYELYISDVNLPFVTLFNISKFSAQDKEKTNKILTSYKDLYVAKFNKDTNKLLIITPIQIDNKNVFDRHNLEVLETSLNNKDIHTMPIGFSGLDGETANSIEGFDTENENWVFDRLSEIAKPLKHTVFDNDGQIDYEEIWNYDENEPIKYEMKNKYGHTVSLLKETFTSTSTYDKEHIFYDNNGQTAMVVSIHYEGANITRFTYFNTNDKENGFTIINEYADGIKTSEKIYNADYTLISDIKAEYRNGQLLSLEQICNQHEVIKKLH